MDKAFKPETEDLLKRMGAEGSLKRALEIGKELIGNPMALFDVSYKLIANSTNTIDDDPLWNELIQNGTFSHETVSFFNVENFIEAFAISDCVSYMPSPKLKYDRMNGAIYDKNGLQIANISLVACNRPFEDGDAALLERICEKLAPRLYNIKLNAVRTKWDVAVSEVIEGRQEELSRELIECLNLSQKGNYCIGVVDILGFDKTLTHIVYFKEKLRSLFCDCELFIYLNNIIILATIPKKYFLPEKFFSLNAKFFEENNLYMGISSVFSKLTDFKERFKEALNALNYGMSLNTNRNIFNYNDVKSEIYITSIIGSIEISNLCNPLIFSILHYDNAHHTTYLDILYSYLYCAGDTEAASASISLNHSEYERKLMKMCELFDIDLHNGNSAFSYFTTIKLMKCLGEDLVLREHSKKK